MQRLLNDQIGLVPAMLLVAVAAVSCVTDLWKGRIYNAVTYPTIALGLAAHLALGGVAGLGFSAAGFACGFFPLFVLFALGGMEGGDVKLGGAIGALAGPVATTEILVCGFLVGGVLALVKLAWQGRLFASLGRVLRYLAGLALPGVPSVKLELDRASTMRFGFSMSMAVLLFLVSARLGNFLGSWMGLA